MYKLMELPKFIEPSPYSDLLIVDGVAYYHRNLPYPLQADLKYKRVQIYAGWYKFRPSYRYPIIYLIGRGKTCGKFYLRVGGFRPYCYAKDPDGEYTTIFGDRVRKIELNNSAPEKIKRLRQLSLKKGKDLFEADIPFVRRFLIDTNGLFKSDEPLDLRILIVDVETNYPVSDDIISFAINKLWEKEITFMSVRQANIWEMTCELLQAFLEADVITGWNVKFDIEHITKYFEHLAFVLKTAYEMNYQHSSLVAYVMKYVGGKDQAEAIISALKTYGYLKELNGYLKPTLPMFLIEEQLNPYKLAAVMDMKEMTKKIIGKELKSWSLENAGLELVGIQKHLSTKYVRDLNDEELMNYNCIDVIIPEEIEEKYGPIRYHINLAWLLQTRLEDTEIHSVVNDIVMLNEYKRHNIVLPSKNVKKRKGGYKAAEPFGLKGVYNNIVAIDLKAAYPSCVLALNASIETRDDNGDIVAANGIRFNRKRSIFVEALKRIMKAREEMKAKLREAETEEERKKLDLMQRALKTQAAAFSHGIFGYEHSRLFFEEVAEAITSTVRYMLDSAGKALEDAGYKVIYKHTDSIYAVVNDKSDVEKVLQIANAAIERICKEKGYLYVPTFEFKEYYVKGYVHSAARNVMVKEDGEWDITGMNLIRSDAPDFVRDIEHDVIQMYLDGKSKDDILKYVLEKLKDLPKNSPDYLGIPKPLRKDPQAYKVKSAHVKAVLNAVNEYGFEINVGEKFLMLPVKNLKSGKGYIAFRFGEFPEGYEIDYFEYVRSVLLGKLSMMLDMNAKDLKKIFEKELECLR